MGISHFLEGKKSQNDLCSSNNIHRIGWNILDHLPFSVTVNLDMYDSSITAVTSFDILSESTRHIQ